MTPYEYFLERLAQKDLSLTDGCLTWDKAQFLSAIETYAQKLRAQGLTPGARVGVYLGKSVHQVAALLAVWKEDLVYVPISRKTPPERLEYVLSNCEISLVFDEPEDVVSGSVLSRYAGSAQSVSYIIYTSGTTGMPKGVVIENAAIASFFEAIRSENFPLRLHQETILQLVDFAFDVSFWDLGLWFLFGGKLVISDFQGNVLNLIKVLTENRVTVMTAAAPTYAILLSSPVVLRRFDLSALKFFVTTASYCPPKVAQDVLSYFEGATLYNCYGPTETTVYCTWTQIRQQDIDLAKPLSIGHPLPGLTVSFLSGEKVVPFTDLEEGAEAELLIEGAQLFRGYWQAGELTDSKVVTKAGKRYYRTGDLTSRSGKNLFYHGRTDDTIKVNGHRVNLGEIEIAAGEVPGLSHGIVLEKENAKFQTELFLFYSLKPGFGKDTVETEVRLQFERKLPAYMHPKKLIWLEEFPVSIAGKIDKKKLRESLHAGL